MHEIRWERSTEKNLRITAPLYSDICSFSLCLNFSSDKELTTFEDKAYLFLSSFNWEKALPLWERKWTSCSIHLLIPVLPSRTHTAIPLLLRGSLPVSFASASLMASLWVCHSPPFHCSLLSKIQNGETPRFKFTHVFMSLGVGNMGQGDTWSASAKSLEATVCPSVSPADGRCCPANPELIPSPPPAPGPRPSITQEYEFLMLFLRSWVILESW